MTQLFIIKDLANKQTRKKHTHEHPESEREKEAEQVLHTLNTCSNPETNPNPLSRRPNEAEMKGKFWHLLKLSATDPMEVDKRLV